ncbi:hypothetical protein BJV78DRAFT_1238670 [Lactifluus subvellereus]|nr:hypothetical protein BJV78DRAFT_1238670 [Lactifluus subvellereus]
MFLGHVSRRYSSRLGSQVLYMSSAGLAFPYMYKDCSTVPTMELNSTILQVALSFVMCDGAIAGQSTPVTELPSQVACTVQCPQDGLRLLT